jgi:hypothetical protein
MHRKTINKVLTELLKDKPDLSYMRGLLEGLVDEEEKPTGLDIPGNAIPIFSKEGHVGWKNPEPVVMDEVSILESEAKAHIAKFGNNLQVE